MIKAFVHNYPVIAEDAFIAATAVIIGNVVIGSKSSIWFNVVIRGDVNSITIGNRTNIQDNSLLHVSGGNGEKNNGYPLLVGNNVTIGHCVILHGCTIEDNALVGMKAMIMDGAIVGRGALIAAGSLVTEGTVIPPETLWMGSPAKFKRELTDEEKLRTTALSDSYVNLSRIYIQDNTYPPA